MAKVKKGDFIELDYTGKVKGEEIIFDTTDEDTARSNDIHSDKVKYGPVVICVGQSDLIKGLDKHLEDKETGKSYTVELSPEEAFGKKDAKLIQLIPTNKFKQNKINPFPGLQVNIDGAMGTIKTVSSGRTLVDFNHPLSGKEVVYEIKVHRVVDDLSEKVSSVVELIANQKPEVEVKDKKVSIKLKKELHPQLQALVKAKIKKTLDLEAEFAK